MAPYLNYGAVKAHAAELRNPKEKTYTVTAYYNGRWFVVPSPRAPDLAFFEGEYHSGNFISRQKFVVTASFLNDPKSWNNHPEKFNF